MRRIGSPVLFGNPFPCLRSVYTDLPVAVASRLFQGGDHGWTTDPEQGDHGIPPHLGPLIVESLDQSRDGVFGSDTAERADRRGSRPDVRRIEQLEGDR